MYDNNFDYDILCGTSVGALNVFGLSLCPKGNPEGSWKSLENIWLNIEGNHSIYRKWFPFGLPSLWKGSVYNTKPLQKMLEKLSDPNALLSCGRKIAIGAVSMNTGEYRIIHGDNPRLIEWIRASCSFPVFFPQVQIEDQFWSDGGLKQNIPLVEAIRLGADEIDVISCFDLQAISGWKTKKGLFKQLDRVIDLMTTEMINDDIRQTGLMNDLSNLGKNYKKVKVRLWSPSQNIDVDSLTFDPKKIREYIELGYNDSLSPRTLGE
jgi:NTE family protein